MDSERLEEVERELAAWQPAGLPEGLAERLREEPGGAREERLTMGDRVLAGFVMCGGMAACVVVGMVVWQMTLPAPAVRSGVDVARQQQQMAAVYRELLAAR